MRITITEEAAVQIRRAAAGEPGEATLRLAARREGEALDFGMGFDRERPGDERVPFEGAVVVVAEASRELLEDATVDYREVAPGEFRFLLAVGGEGA